MLCCESFLPIEELASKSNMAFRSWKKKTLFFQKTEISLEAINTCCLIPCITESQSYILWSCISVHHLSSSVLGRSEYKTVLDAPRQLYAVQDASQIMVVGRCVQIKTPLECFIYQIGAVTVEIIKAFQILIFSGCIVGI